MKDKTIYIDHVQDFFASSETDCGKKAQKSSTLVAAVRHFPQHRVRVVDVTCLCLSSTGLRPPRPAS